LGEFVNHVGIDGRTTSQNHGHPNRESSSPPMPRAQHAQGSVTQPSEPSL
jgi:hypothetical protein